MFCCGSNRRKFLEPTEAPKETQNGLLQHEDNIEEADAPEAEKGLIRYPYDLLNSLGPVLGFPV